MLCLKDCNTNTEFEIPNGQINEEVNSTLVCFIGDEFYKGGALLHGKRIVGRYLKNEAHISITFRQMKKKVCDLSNIVDKGE